MFVEPEATKPKATVKPDPTASARSSIRRQRTVRYSPNVRDHQSTLNAITARNQDRSHGRMRMLANRRSLLEDIRRRDRSATSSASTADDVQDLEAAADLAHSEAIQRNRLDSGRALLRDALSYERPGRRTRIAREDPLPRPHRIRDRSPPLSSIDAGDPRVPSRPESTRSPPPRYMPTPPHTSGDPSTRSSPYTSPPNLGTASLTPGFAPAHRLDRQDEIRANLEREELLVRLAARMDEMSDDGEREYVAGHRAEINRMRSRNPAELTIEYREAEAAYLESVETRLDVMRRMRERDISELPHLQRMSRPHHGSARSPHGRSQENVDGLGDRERSFSPDDDQWETMLTTIQPDERVPSTHSSFTSTTASSSSRSSNPVSSYGTLVTAPSTATDVEACPADLDDSEDNDSIDDSIDIASAQLSQAENQSRRIESLSRIINDQRQSRDEHQARRRRMLQREEELLDLEANLRRLERQISEEQPVAAGRSRRDGDRTGRERL